MGGRGSPNWESELGGHVGGCVGVHGRPCFLRLSERPCQRPCERPCQRPKADRP